MSFYGIFWFCIAYAIPAGLFIILYTKIIFTLRKRQQVLEEVNQSSRVLDAAERQLTKAAIIVTIVFIFSLTWDTWCYLLGRFKIIHFEKNTWQSVLGVFLVAVNSRVNPFIYVGSLPVFRRSLKKTFRLETLNKKKTPKESKSVLDKTQSKEETSRKEAFLPVSLTELVQTHIST